MNTTHEYMMREFYFFTSCLIQRLLTKNIDGIVIQSAKLRQIGTVSAAVYIPR